MCQANMGKTVQRKHYGMLNTIFRIWIWLKKKKIPRCAHTPKMVETDIERSLSIYASFYLHARIWHPIVNNKVISLFATLNLSFVRFVFFLLLCAFVSCLLLAFFFNCRSAVLYLNCECIFFLLLCCLSMHWQWSAEQWAKSMCSSMQCSVCVVFLC